MPNHVYNNLSVSGDKELVSKFFEDAKATYTQTYFDWEDKTNKRNMKSKEIKADFSYRKFVAPPTENYEDEVAPEGGLIQNWYDWNRENWGTKWDAYDVCVDTSSGSISFASAWSPPIPVVEAIITKYPALHFEFSYEEENGWGGEMTFENGELVAEKTWDEPGSHADYVALDRTGQCICSYEDDRDEWYKDCPKENDEN